ncbi:hypothetical protein [Nocardioides convexus]|uniref:hypothetical protein n=1 Tax=Nocardioides convexus TaxID=2712224 RepID=UPI0024181A80|nr:hypothetical protein [Nocardioides convexus]
MTKGVDAPELDPADVVRSAYDGLEAGAYEILADESQRAGQGGPGRSRRGVVPPACAGARADPGRHRMRGTALSRWAV